TGAGAIIYHSDFENKIGPIINKPELSIKQIRVDDSPETAANSYSKIIRDFSPFRDERYPDKNDPAIIQFGPDTYKMPQGAVISHAGLLESSKTIISVFDITNKDRITGLLHVSNPMAQTFSLNCAVISGAAVLLDNSDTERNMLGVIVGGNASVVVGNPELYEKIIIPQKNVQLKTDLRLGIVSNEESSIDLFDQFDKIFKSRLVKCFYLAETTSVITHLEKSDSDSNNVLGIPFEGVKIMLIDESGEEVFDEEEGTLFIKSPMNMIGYFSKNEIKNVQGEYINSGYICHGNSIGEILQKCHTNDLVYKAGFYINTREIEKQLKDHPDIEEAVVIGIPDTDRIREFRSYVVPTPKKEVKSKDLFDHVRGKLPVYKCPKEVVIVDSLPKDENGKVIKRLLK
ncbi:MAG: acyl--CoA ligase, partial [bacterium]|nr:acyl--CoA ligase [bacterium]